MVAFGWVISSATVLIASGILDDSRLFIAGCVMAILSLVIATSEAKTDTEKPPPEETT